MLSHVGSDFLSGLTIVKGVMKWGCDADSVGQGVRCGTDWLISCGIRVGAAYSRCMRTDFQCRASSEARSKANSNLFNALLKQSSLLAMECQRAVQFFNDCCCQ